MITSCGDDVVDPHSPEPNGEDMIPVTISRVEDGSYMENHVDTPDTTGRRTLVNEWVPVKEPPTGRVIPAVVPYEGPSMVRMTFREESQATTRAITLGNSIYFRLITFRKVDSNYIFQSTADSTTSGASAPTFRQGELFTRAGTVRVIGYSFNSTTAMGTTPSAYAYSGTSVTIPSMSSGSMVYDSGDIVNVSITNHSLSVGFMQRLCKLMVKLSLSQLVSNTFTNCTGIYVSQGGSASAWTIGPSTSNVSVNTGNTSMFNIANNSTITMRLVPFSGSRAITAHISTLTLSNYFNTDNQNTTSSQNVQLLPGESYTITLKFESGVQLAASDINLTQNGCTVNDRNNLTKLRWATGNLKNTGNTSYVQTTATDRGYYYMSCSTYTGNANTNNTDPCSRLNIAYCGTGWRTPSRNTLATLSRCTNKALTDRGMWLTSSSIGFFLPATGYRSDNREGSGVEAITGPNTEGYYQSRDGTGGAVSYFMLLRSGTARIQAYQKKDGKTVRCVKGD